MFIWFSLLFSLLRDTRFKSLLYNEFQFTRTKEVTIRIFICFFKKCIYNKSGPVDESISFRVYSFDFNFKVHRGQAMSSDMKRALQDVFEI